jgi:hypothetical protein
MINYFTERNKIGCLIAVKTAVAFHSVSIDDNGYVRNVSQLTRRRCGLMEVFLFLKNKYLTILIQERNLCLNPSKGSLARMNWWHTNMMDFGLALTRTRTSSVLDELASNNASLGRFGILISNEIRSYPS